MSGIVRRAGRAVRLGGLALALALALAAVLPATAGSAATSPDWWTASTAPVAGLNPAVGVPSSTTGLPPDLDLSDVACPAAGSCVAVGYYQDAQGYDQPLAEVQSGGVWQAASVPLTGLDPAATTAANPEAKLTALSCPAVGTCVAIGTYRDSSGSYWGLIERLSGGVWTAGTAPSPAGSIGDSADSISCPSANWCVAAGQYWTTLGGDLVDTLSNGTWTPTALPDSGLSLGSEQVPLLRSVSCWSAGSCVAVGSYLDPTNHTWPLVTTLNAGTWSWTQPSVSQLDLEGESTAQLTQVSCTSDGFCAAAGSYYDSSNHPDAMVATRSGDSWSVLPAPDAGLSPARETGTTSNVAGILMDVNQVQCPASGSCVAVGEYVDVNGTEDPLAEILSNGTWSARTLPLAGLGPAASNVRQMSRISCPTISSCVAIGAYWDNSGGDTGLVHGIIETLSNGTWTATTAPVTGLDPGVDAIGSSESEIPVSPNAVACGSAGSCVSVGYYESVAGGLRGLIETLGDTAGGYWLTTSAGNVYNFNAPWYGSQAGTKLPSPVVGIAADGDGYLLTTKAGNVYNFNTPWSGSEAGKTLPAPVIGIAADPATGGYWLATSNGTVYSFNAPSYPSEAGDLSAPVVGITAEADGYVLATSDGNIYNFGASTYGSQAGKTLSAPVVGVGNDPATLGYWLTTRAGNVYNFNASWTGSAAGTKLPSPVVGLAAEGDGYLLTTKAGNVYNFDAPWSGSEASRKLPAPVVGIATAG